MMVIPRMAIAFVCIDIAPVIELSYPVTVRVQVPKLIYSSDYYP